MGTAIHLHRKDQELIIASVYQPNDSPTNKNDVKKFQQYIVTLLNEAPELAYVILMGDWNGCMNPSLDREIATDLTAAQPTVPTQTTPESKILRTICNISNPHRLVDVYREKHPITSAFTHIIEHDNQSPSQSRIDFALVTRNTSRLVEDAWISGPIDALSKMHHLPIGITINLPNFYLKTNSLVVKPSRLLVKHITAESIEKFDSILYKNNENIERLLIDIANERFLTAEQVPEHMSDIYIRTEREIKRAMKAALPMTNTATPTNDQARKQPYYRQTWRKLIKLMHSEKKDLKISQQDHHTQVHRIYSLFQKEGDNDEWSYEEILEVCYDRLKKAQRK